MAKTKRSSNALLTCEGDISDPDLETVSTILSWNVDGTIVQSETLQLDPSTNYTGQEIGCTIKATDPHGSTHERSSSVRIKNTLPSIDHIELSIEHPTSQDSLSCSVQTSDFDLDPVTTSYVWLIDGQNTGETNPVLSSPLPVDSEITCVTTPFDGKDFGESASVTTSVVNIPPTIDSIDITPSQVFADSVLNCTTTYSDRDPHPVQLSQYWLQNGNPVGEGTTLSLNPTIFSVGDTIECHAMVVDETGATDTDIVSTIVSNTAPQILEPATISSSTGTITTNSTLTCSANFFDLNDGTLSY